MFAYCGNNPVVRKDGSGKSWLAILGAIGVQYAADVLGNIAAGKTGLDIFAPTSSLGTYTAAAVTALIPGSTVVSSLVRSVVSETIEWVDNELNGKSELNDLNQSVGNVFKNTFIDYSFGVLMDATFGKAGSNNFSDHAPDLIKNGAATTLNQAYDVLQRSNTLGRGLGKLATKICEVVVCYFTQ